MPAIWGSLAVLTLVFVYFYGFHPISQGRSLAHWCWLAWNSKNDTLHGRIIPLGFVIMCWLAAKGAKDEPKEGNSWGLVVLLAGISFFLISVRTIQPRLALVGLPFLIMGGLLYLFGWKYSRHFLFPSFLWWFAIPIPQIQQATSLLQLMVSKMCFTLGNALGMGLSMQGNTIRPSGGDSWGFDIAEACSGIRSLMALTMISAVYAHLTQKVLWKKVVLFLSSVPLAIMGNFFRVFTIIVLAELGYEKFAAATYHDWAGLLIFFPLALSGLFAIDYFLNRGPKRKLRVRTQNPLSSTGDEG